MVAITATSTASPSLQQTLLHSKVAQARREAEQAEDQAQNLRREADQAEKDAQQSRTRYHQTQQKAADYDATYSAPSRTQRSEVPRQTQDFLVRMYNATAEKFAASGNPLKSNTNSSAVKNGLGQSIGRIVNLHT